MAETALSNRWLYRLLYLVIAAAIAFAQLLPIHPGPIAMPGPDILLLLTLAWLIRRPETVPVLVIAVVFLLADLLFMRPPGLWAVIVVVMTEIMRSRIGPFREMNFLVEWLVIGAYLAVATLVLTVIQTVFFVPQPALGQTLLRLLVTVLAYPLVVVFGARALGIVKPAPGEDRRLGAVP